MAQRRHPTPVGAAGENRRAARWTTGSCSKDNIETLDPVRDDSRRNLRCRTISPDATARLVRVCARKANVILVRPTLFAMGNFRSNDSVSGLVSLGWTGPAIPTVLDRSPCGSRPGPGRDRGGISGLARFGNGNQLAQSFARLTSTHCRHQQRCVVSQQIISSPISFTQDTAGPMPRTCAAAAHDEIGRTRWGWTEWQRWLRRRLERPIVLQGKTGRRVLRFSHRQRRDFRSSGSMLASPRWRAAAG